MLRCYLDYRHTTRGKEARELWELHSVDHYVHPSFANIRKVSPVKSDPCTNGRCDRCFRKGGCKIQWYDRRWGSEDVRRARRGSWMLGDDAKARPLIWRTSGNPQADHLDEARAAEHQDDMRMTGQTVMDPYHDMGKSLMKQWRATTHLLARASHSMSDRFCARWASRACNARPS